jgi:hypothetical protein
VEDVGGWRLENEPAGVSISGTGLISIQADASLQDINEIDVIAEYEGVSYKKVLTISKAKDGVDGQNTVAYLLLLSTDKAQKKADGTIVPTSVSAKSMKYDGENPPVEDTTVTNIKYRTSADEVEVDGNSVVLDDMELTVE